ncbi:hypothetical protein [Sphingomonas mesophila]|uniref:hypothetical protein n=1 Tax=Sphingomonas mesophila TaxID=2303576 RepID=UPI000E56AD75|nr:hypothetical protein [Sphingomonas mesophila]
MHLVTILLPITRSDGSPQPRTLFAKLRTELIERFGGVTFFSRAPAEGLWEDEGKVEHDQIVLVEVLVQSLERHYWTELRTRLERDFAQDEILIRASAVERL